jgi:hypothetical protein
MKKCSPRDVVSRQLNIGSTSLLFCHGIQRDKVLEF